MADWISRREFLVRSTAFSLASPMSALAGTEAQGSKDKLREFDYDAVQLNGGPLKEQYDRIRASYLALDNDRLLKVYRERAGLLAPGAEMGGWYSATGFVPGHSLGQYISGLARIGRTNRDSGCIAKVSELVNGFASTLGNKDQVFAGPNAEKVWPCYVLDKHLAGLLDAFHLCGVKEARDLVPRVFRGALPYIPERGHDRAGKREPPYDETYVLPENLFDAYSLIGERQLYDRAVAYLLDREFFDPLARGQDVLPGKHAYSHAISLSSAAKARLILGDDRYLRTIENAWTFLTEGQQYASGGWGPNEIFIEPRKGQLYASLQSTEDHFETPCGSYAAMKLARYLLRATGDARYGDGLERVVYNCLLAVKEPDGDGSYPYYSTYSPNGRKVFYPQKWPCCSGTLVQGVADYVKNIYFRRDDGVVVNFYTPSSVHWHQGGEEISLSQETDYPVGQVVRILITTAGPEVFTLALRVPGWLAEAPRIHVNGKQESPAVNRGFASIRRTWRKGDQVTLELPQDFRTEPIDELHTDTVAIMRGPLLYVQMNPGEREQKLPRLDALRSSGSFLPTYTEAAPQTRVFLPLYFVRNERYSTYFNKE